MIAIQGDPGYQELKNRLIASTGLAFYLERDKELTEAIGQRLADLRLAGCTAYSDFLSNGVQGEKEMDRLIAKLTIGETSFFRDQGQFDAIRDRVLPDILNRKHDRKLRIWSAGCATGAEPYSLAILLAQMAEQIAGWETCILATDLNRDFLARAAEGKFRAWALRSTSEAVQRECFSRDGLTWTIRPEYKRSISFRHMNLIDGDFEALRDEVGPFDLILCRNVMIYFSPEANRLIVDNFHQSLVDCGWLIVGAAEHNLQNYKSFVNVSESGLTLYQKEQSKDVPIKPPKPETQRFAPTLPRRRMPPVVEVPAEPDRTAMDELVQLADCADWQGASEHGRLMLTRERLNPEFHFYQALIFENLAKVEEAERSLRQALYLDRNFALAHYHLGLALKRDGKVPASGRSFANVLRSLAGLPDNLVLRAGRGVTAIRLKELARMQLGGQLRDERGSDAATDGGGLARTGGPTVATRRFGGRRGRYPAGNRSEGWKRALWGRSCGCRGGLATAPRYTRSWRAGGVFRSDQHTWRDSAGDGSQALPELGRDRGRQHSEGHSAVQRREEDGPPNRKRGANPANRTSRIAKHRQWQYGMVLAN